MESETAPHLPWQLESAGRLGQNKKLGERACSGKLGALISPSPDSGVHCT